MNNFQHASKSDVLDLLIEDSDLTPKPESPRAASPEAAQSANEAQPVALGFSGDAVVNEFGRGVRVEIPSSEEEAEIEREVFAQNVRLEQAESPQRDALDLEYLDSELLDAGTPSTGTPSTGTPSTGTANTNANAAHANAASTGVSSTGASRTEPSETMSLFEADRFENGFENDLLSDGLAENSPAPDIFDAALFDEVMREPEDSPIAPVALPPEEAPLSPEEAPENDLLDRQASSDSDQLQEDFQEEYAVEGEETEAYILEEFEEFAEDEAELSEAAGTVDTFGEVMEVEVIDSEERDRSYEVYQQGSLTYFRYYLDDEDNAAPYDHDAPISPKPFLSAGAMGIGVLAATFGVGLLVAETTNRRTEVATGGEQRQADGSPEMNTPLQDSAASPESEQPAFATKDQGSGAQSLAAKMQGKEGAIAKDPTSTLASAAEKLSGASTNLAAQTEIAQASSSSGSGAPGPSSTWRTSTAAAPYVAPVVPALPADYQVVPMMPLPPVNLAQVSPASRLVQPTATLSAEDQRLAARVEALRQNSNGSASSLPSAPLASLNSATSNAAAGSPSGTGQTYITDPIRSMTPVPEASYQPVYPSSNPPTVQPLTAPSASVPNSGSSSSGAAVAAASPGLLAPPPVSSISADALRRAEEQKRLLNQAIAKPITGLLVVPVAAESSDEKQSAVPLNVEPFAVETSPPLSETPSALASTPVNPAPVNLIASLGQLLTLAQQPETADLQPIASGVANEVRAAERIEQFRVLALSNSDYEQLWRMSAKPENSLIAPVYGFVDYQRNVIAVVEAGSANFARIQPELAPETEPEVQREQVQREQVQQIAQALMPSVGEI